MNCKLLTAGLSAVAALAVAAVPASATIIGGSSQSSKQGTNSSQLANAPSATGDVIVIGGGGAAGPPPTQQSVNSETSAQAVGSAGGGGVFISPTGVGPTQSNEQATNSSQISAGGAIGLQGSTNVEANSQIIGGDQSCVLAAVPCESSVIIGTPTQDNNQGTDSLQSADGGVTNGTSVTTPTVVLNGLAGPTSQLSFNVSASSQLILG